MMGFEFESNTQPYSIDNLGQAIGVFFFEFFQAFVSGQRQYLIYSLCVGIIGICFNVTTLFFDFKPRVNEVNFYPNKSIRQGSSRSNSIINDKVDKEKLFEIED